MSIRFAIPAPVDGASRPSLSDLRRWLRRAWTLFRAAPVRGYGLALLPLILEVLIQAIPVAGIVLSKVLVPLASAWVLALLYQRATLGQWRVRAAGARWRQRLPALLQLALALAVLVFGFQMLVLAALAGPEQAAAVALRDIGALQLSRWQITGMLVSGLVPAALVIFVPGQVLLGGRSLTAAFGDSVRALVRFRVPLACLLAVTGLLLASAAWMPLVLLVYLPFGMYVGYAAWEDLFAHGAMDRAA